MVFREFPTSSYSQWIPSHSAVRAIMVAKRLDIWEPTNQLEVRNALNTILQTELQARYQTKGQADERTVELSFFIALTFEIAFLSYSRQFSVSSSFDATDSRLWLHLTNDSFS